MKKKKKKSRPCNRQACWFNTAFGFIKQVTGTANSWGNLAKVCFSFLVSFISCIVYRIIVCSLTSYTASVLQLLHWIVISVFGNLVG